MDQRIQSNGTVERPRSIPFEPYGKVRSFEIILDRHNGPNGVGLYTPGDLLSGHVRLDLSQRLTVNNIDLLVQGTGNVAWKLRGFQGEELVSDDEVYLNEIAELVGKRSNEMVTLSVGEHIFPFACELPWELPATFTGSNGSVSYLVKVVIQADRNEPAHMEPCIATEIFLLESRLSTDGLGDQLNSYRVDYKHPVKSSGLNTGSSSVKVSLFMPRRAYDIGDNIVVNMSLTNTSKKAVKSMSLALVMETMYRVGDRTMSERLLVADHEDAFVVRHLESRQWRHVGLQVPRCIPPSGLPYSKLISVKYLMVFKAELDRTQDVVTFQTPVLIGLQLPDEMKLDTIDGSLMEAAPTDDDVASGRRPSPSIVYQGKKEPRVDYGQNRAQNPPTAASSHALQRPLYVDVNKPVGRTPSPVPQQQQQKQQQQHQPLPQLQPQQRKQPQQQHLQAPEPMAHYQPMRQQQQQQPSRASPRGAEADSQVISMRFTDELDDHSPYGQPHRQQRHQEDDDQHYPQQQQHHQAPKVSRNPLFVPDDEVNREGAHEEQQFGSGNGGGYNGEERRMMSALDANLDNGDEEVLY